MAGNAHGADGAAVIGPVERKDARPAGGGDDDPGDRLIGVGAGMAEPDAAAGALRHERKQLFGEQHASLVGR